MSLSKGPAIDSRRVLNRCLVRVVDPVCISLGGQRMKGSRLAWHFNPVPGCPVGLWAQVEGWERAFRLEGLRRQFAVRFEVGVGRPGADMYERAASRGTTTLMEVLGRESRDRLAHESWQVIRAVAGEDVVAWANDELALHFRVEEGDSFFPVSTERDLAILVNNLEEALPHMIQTQVERAASDG